MKTVYLPFVITIATLSLCLFQGERTHAGGSTPDGHRPIDRIDRTARYVDGEVLVKYKSGTTVSLMSKSMGLVGAEKLETKMKTIQRLKVDESVSVEDAVATLTADPAVEFAQPNFIYHTLALPTDPNFAQQWGLNNTAQSISSASYSTNNPGTTGNDIGMSKAWNLVTDCSSVLVAEIDTGINYNHEDLSASMWVSSTYTNHGKDFVGSGDNDPMDENGHGSHVAGIIGAVAGNNKGGSGVCQKANIAALRALDASGTGTSASIVAALEFAMTINAKVVNMSLGTGEDDPSIKTAITNLSNAGVVLVVAAGNDGVNNDSTATYPCNYNLPNLICVAAIDQKFFLASFSNWGATSVHVAAPGTNILSSVIGSTNYSELPPSNSGTFAWTGSTVWNWASYKLTSSDGSSANYPMVILPNGWNQTIKYAASLDESIYQSIAIDNTATKLVLYLGGFKDIASGDKIKIYARSGTATPFSNTYYTGVDVTGTSGSSSFTDSIDLSSSNCFGASMCTIGLEFISTSGSSRGTGVALYEVSIANVKINNTSYDVYDGTSMATPHVAGLAAMIWSYNPSYSAGDVVAAIKEGGVPSSSLSGKTTTGKVINAYGSLNYIRAPSGVTATSD